MRRLRSEQQKNRAVLSGVAAILMFVGLTVGGCQQDEAPGSTTPAAAPASVLSKPASTISESATPKRWVTQGPAEVVVDNLYKCPVVVDDYRDSGVGRIAALDGTEFTVPAATRLEAREGPMSVDLYNECTGVMPENSSEVDPEVAPIIEIDSDGEVVTGYIVADNYYELYVNGVPVSADNTPYTPLNSAIVRFRVKRPYTLAFMAVDWDEHLGLGMELFPQGPDRMHGGNPWYAGNAGLIAHFSDGTVTDASWRAQSFSIAPLDSPDEVIENGDVHDTSARGRANAVAKRAQCSLNGGEVTGDARLFPAFARLPSSCYAVHYAIPEGWQARDFDDSNWPQADEYTDEEVGVTDLPAYNRYPELFSGARWIWSNNLVLDNLILTRKTVR